MISKQKYLNFYTNCFIVKGFSRSIIQDFFLSKYYFIPELLCDVINNFNSKKINVIEENYTENNEIIYQYLNFLETNNLAFFSNNIIPFQVQDLIYRYQGRISNAILKISKTIDLNSFNFLVSNLEKEYCENIQIYITEQLDTSTLRTYFDSLNCSNISNVELIIPFFKSSFSKMIIELMKEFERISKILIFNAKRNYSKKIHKNSKKIIIFTTEDFSYENDCGNVHPYLFKNNTYFFTESQCHNTCLNRKLCIDQNGEIKNCPAMAKSYGNIKDTALKEVISNPEFQELWTISKDQIDVCQDCEFRHMCMDCRAFIKDPENIYSQPAKCTYNPYICKWDGQDGYIPVEECGTYTRETGFVPDIEKINALNKLIWGEDD